MKNETQIISESETQTNPKEIIQINTQKPKTPKQKSFLVVGLTVLVFILLVVSGFFAYQNYQLKKDLAQKISLISLTSEKNNQAEIANPTPTTDLTADWETYSSSTYEFKYPNDFKLQLSEGSTAILQKWGATQTEGTELFDGIQISFQPREIDISLENLVNSIVERYKNMEGFKQIIEGPASITINNWQGLTFTTEGLGTYENIILEKGSDNMFIHIAAGFSGPSGLEFEKIKDQIISTFKFIDNEKSTDPLTVATEYLDAYVNQNWDLAKKLCNDPDFDEKLAEGYGFVSYKIVGSEYDSNPDYYYVYISFTDSEGRTINKTSSTTTNKPLSILMFKNESGNWRALTWYFFQ